MASVFVPTLWTNKTNSIIVGIFQYKHEAIKALFRKMVEEKYIYINEEADYTQDEFIENLYDDFIDLSYNNSRDDFYCDYDLSSYITLSCMSCGTRKYIKSGFGKKWSCKIDTQDALEKPVMK